MRVVIIHGWANNKKDNPAGHWIPWIKNKLESKNVEVFTPLMPEAWKPNYFNWEKKFEKIKIDENTILIGHSCGCAFLVRWLGNTKKKVKKLILVAPWKIPNEKNDISIKFYNYSIDKTIKERVKEIIIFTSNNEEEDGKKSVKIFHKALRGKIIELKERGHYTKEDMKTTEFPELLKEILE